MPTTTKVTLPRFPSAMFGWVNRLLRIDLSTHHIWAEETARYLPDFLGGRGLAAKIVWDE
jgi:aldehyde:ferredoxin oxidoreductase